MRGVIQFLFCSARQGGRLPVALMLCAFLFQTGAAHGGTVYLVTNANDSGVGSLRWAITNANANPGVTNNISFDINGTPPFTINLSSALPAVANPWTIIDATTQPGYSGTPMVELNGASAGSRSVGLQLTSPFNIVKGLAINRFSSYGIHLNGASNVIQGNFIGTDTTGTLALGNGTNGILVESSGNQIGGSKGFSLNVISGNNFNGIYIYNTSSNAVQGNYIGISATGAGALGNANSGIFIFGSVGNLIGGPGGARNFISGNGVSGIFLNGLGTRQNVISNNFIGTDNSGTLVVSNANDGITVSGAPSNTISGNIISGNGTNGVYLAAAGATGNILVGNFIGTDATGKLALGNHNAGVTITGNGNLIGVSNVISGNLHDGIILTGGAGGNLVQGNLIGLSATGTNALPNGVNGIEISSASSNSVGGFVSTARNVISGNAANGVVITTVTDAFNTVCGNYIGTDITGGKGVANLLSGVLVQGCSNVVGGVLVGSGNVISGNGRQGVWLVGTKGSVIGNVVQGNLIGLDVTGANGLGNTGAGVGITGAASNQIGGATAGVRNVISANGNNGVFLIGSGAAGNLVQGNYIGTDRTGSLPRSNFQDGIVLQDVINNQIGGSVSGAGNLISGNNANAFTGGNNGIYLTNAAWNLIQGNRIGTDASGALNLSNSWNAIYMQNANSNQIGGGVAGAGNQLSANGRDAIYLTLASWNVIQGNFIGTKADGTNALGNVDHGIDIYAGATNNTIGGPATGAGNRIAFAQTLLYSGVRVRTGSLNNLISGNSIFNNGGLGIDLGVNGVTPNVDCETGQGTAANAGQNYPVLTNVACGTATQIRGTLNSGMGRAYLRQFFSNPSGNTNGYGEGRFFLGQTNLTLGATMCSSNFTVVLPVSVPAGWVVTATATDPANNTSEFSAWLPAVAVPRVQTITVNRINPQVSLSWTNNGGSYVLQQTFSLAPPQQWITVTNAPSLVNGFFVLTLPATNVVAFYRLQAP